MSARRTRCGRTPAAGPQIRLFDPDAIRDQPTGQELSPRLKLRQFFERWFLPTILRKSRDATVRKYYDALAWWEAITGDPDLGDITDAVCLAFADELPHAKYRRACVRRGASIPRARAQGSALYRTLAPISAAKHVNRIAAILGRAGPRFDPREPVAEILERCPLMPRLEGSFPGKAPFALEAARAIAAEAGKFDRPDMPAEALAIGLTPSLFWRVLLGEFYYTGLRSGTVLRLQIKHFLAEGGDWPLLDVPADIVLKTSKATRLAVHPQLAGLLREVIGGRGADARGREALILPAVCSYSHLLDLHAQLQRRAGLAAADIQSLHAWRRTHGNQMAILGADRGLEIARASLDHADGATTRSSYVNEAFLNRLRVKLPELWPRRLFD